MLHPSPSPKHIQSFCPARASPEKATAPSSFVIMSMSRMLMPPAGREPECLTHHPSRTAPRTVLCREQVGCVDGRQHESTLRQAGRLGEKASDKPSGWGPWAQPTHWAQGCSFISYSSLCNFELVMVCL